MGGGRIRFVVPCNETNYLTVNNIQSVTKDGVRQEVSYGKKKKIIPMKESEIVLEDRLRGGNKRVGLSTYAEYWANVIKINYKRASELQKLMIAPPLQWSDTAEKIEKQVRKVTNLENICKMRFKNGVDFYTNLYMWLFNDERRKILRHNQELLSISWHPGAKSKIWIDYASERWWEQKAGGLVLADGSGPASELVYGRKYVYFWCFIECFSGVY